jgi:hypothetical protein
MQKPWQYKRTNLRDLQNKNKREQAESEYNTPCSLAEISRSMHVSSTHPARSSRSCAHIWKHRDAKASAEVAFRHNDRSTCAESMEVRRR